MAGLRILLLIYMLRFAAALHSLEELKKKVYNGAEQFTQFINQFGSKIGLEHFCDKYSCPQGLRLVRNQSAAVPLSNGCGTYGVTIPRNLIPLTTACCDVHDICYSTCGMQRRVCDRQFNFCLDRVCANVTQHPERFPRADPEASLLEIRTPLLISSDVCAMAGLRILLLIYMVHFAGALDFLDELKRKVYSLAEQLAHLINTLGSMTCCYCDKYLCPQGLSLVRNQSAPHPKSDGCGSYGLTIPQMFLPLVTACCDGHDLCYGTCGVRRSTCDRQFKTCLDSICANVTEHPEMFPESDPEACRAKARLFDALVTKFGCSAFLSAQARYCYCG
ncbi:hypothetical protein M514_10849 [Trichuris suis]|uniref:Uncharacterized protein n=1 Tax=Trichuris suis TaxID=68888 RepID=A0A085N1C8_9BILA|nr:hypothetical protein M514_10849 [Trichuris suis]KHJ41747.1 hypothetical protein D918_08118 [Trichuris suis]